MILSCAQLQADGKVALEGAKEMPEDTMEEEKLSMSSPKPEADIENLEAKNKESVAVEAVKPPKANLEQKPASERPSAEAVKKDSASKDGKAKLKENPAELDESKVEKASEKTMSVKEGGERVEMPADLADQSTDKKETEISADAQVDAQTATKADHMQKSLSRR